MTNDAYLPLGPGIVGASHYFGLSTIDAEKKQIMRALSVRGGPYILDERKELLTYCEGDVAAVARLYAAMHERIDFPRALLRGRYISALSSVEAHGLPIDTSTLALLRGGWGGIHDQVIRTLDAPYGFYEGGSFGARRFENWVNARGILWPRLQSGKLRLDKKTFKLMATVHDSVAPVRELRRTLSTMHDFSLVAGRDGRSRLSLKPWQSKTSRNQPSPTEFLFGLPKWMRGLLKPGPGRALSYVDWSQQEFGIAAALSGDVVMMAAYVSGDPYLAFAKQAGAVPPDGTRENYEVVRAQFKECALGVLYGMGDRTLALRINQTSVHAQALIRQHRRTYSTFWDWSDGAVSHALSGRNLQSTFGWTIRPGKIVNERSIRNFPVQSNGAEMMRIACILAVEAGVQVCATVHDAFVIEAAIDDISQAEAIMQDCMVQASRLVLNGFELRSDTKQIIYPDRYLDDKGKYMWHRVMGMLAPPEAEASEL